MSLKDQILADMKTAMREKTTSRLESIRLLRAAIQRVEVDNRIELGDDDVIAIVQQQIKQSKDAITQFIKGNRPDLAEKEQAHIDNLKVYQPKQLDSEAVRSLVEETISKIGATSMQDMGQVMRTLKPKLLGRADLKQVSEIIKHSLQN